MCLSGLYYYSSLEPPPPANLSARSRGLGGSRTGDATRVSSMAPERSTSHVSSTSAASFSSVAVLGRQASGRSEPEVMRGGGGIGEGRHLMCSRQNMVRPNAAPSVMVEAQTVGVSCCGSRLPALSLSGSDELL